MLAGLAAATGFAAGLAGTAAAFGLAAAAGFAGKKDPGGADFQSGCPGPPLAGGNSSGVNPSIACDCENTGKHTFESVSNPQNTVVSFFW